MEKNELENAITVCKDYLHKNPKDAYILTQLSYLYSLDGCYRIAREYALRAHAATPANPQVVAELIARLRTFNEGEALLQCLQRMLPLSRIPIPLLLAFAAQLSYLNLPERALPLLDEAKRGDPHYPPTLLARAQVLMYLGRFDEAEAEALQATQRAPEIAQGWWLLAQMRKQTKDKNHVQQLQKRVQLPQRHPEHTAMLAYALHKELDDLHLYPQAWEALQLACRAKRSALNYDAGVNKILFDGLKSFKPPASAEIGKTSITTPVFIVGMHRSGTTLLEQLLSAHSQVQGLGELYDFTSAMRYTTDHHCKGVIDRTIVERACNADLADAGRRYLQSIAWRIQDKSFFTDKLPSNFLNLGFICPALPQAKILHMVRDPVETCFSNLRELFSDANAYSYDMLELADYYREYRNLMRHWHEIFPGRILDVDYARLVAQPEAVMREICDFFGMDFEMTMLDMRAHKHAVVTASAVQVRNSIVKREQPKWMPYAQWLQPMIARLAAE